MSETNKKNRNGYKYNSCSFETEEDRAITTGDSDSRSSEPIPEFPNPIVVDTHSFEVAEDGKIIRIDTNTGRQLGEVKDPKAIKAIKGKAADKER